MGENGSMIITELESIVEDIDSLSFGDVDACGTISNALETLMKDVPPNAEEVARAIALCQTGLYSSSDSTNPSSCLSILSSVSDVLSCAVDYLQGGEKDPLLEAADQLQRMLLQDGDMPRAENADLDGESLHRAVNDVAALLIQTDLEDAAAIQVLRDAMDGIAGCETIPESLAERLGEACRTLGRLDEGGGGEEDSILEMVGACLEEVAAALDETSAEGVDGPGEAREKGSPADADVARLPEDFDPDLLSEFVTEALDLISSAEEALLSLETDPDDTESVGTVFRAFHTIKGTSAFLELGLISEMGHHAESLLSRVRDGEIRYAGGYADLALRSLDMLKELVQSVTPALQSGVLVKPEGYDELLRILSNPEAAGFSEEVPSGEAMTGDEEVPRLGDILVQGGSIGRKDVEEAVAGDKEQRFGMSLIRKKGVKASDVAQALRTQRQMRSKRGETESTVRVSTSRLDRLVDLVGELVIAHSMVAQDGLITAAGNHEVAKKVSHTSKIVRELQDLSMSMRMIPLKATFNKMARLVRDLTRKVGKNVHLHTEGEETEIDRNMVDVINDPLVHMIRNAVDHGIEFPEERRQAGKPEEGRIRLSAYHSAGNVVVEIKDDGRGLNRDAILRKAMDQGLIADASGLSERDIYNLIFEPGFSTAREVTDVSGRGVGMDVVRKNIEKLRGQVEISSQPGQGSVFRMSLPLTLAIIDGMVVRVGEDRYVIPTASIVRAIKPKEEELSSVFENSEMLSLQGELLPLFRLGSLFQIQTAKHRATEALAVVLEDDGKRVGLLIDEMIGRQQTVIKSLGEAMRDIPGIAGGAIMPNGSVGLIVDVAGVVRLANGGDGRHGSTRDIGMREIQGR